MNKRTKKKRKDLNRWIMIKLFNDILMIDGKLKVLTKRMKKRMKLYIGFKSMFTNASNIQFNYLTERTKKLIV